MAAYSASRKSREVPRSGHDAKQKLGSERNGFSNQRVQDDKHRAIASEILHSIQRLTKTTSTCYNILSAIQTDDLEITKLGIALGTLGGVAKLFYKIVNDSLNIPVTAYIVVGSTEELSALIRKWSSECAELSLALSDIVRDTFHLEASKSSVLLFGSRQLQIHIEQITESIRRALVPVNSFVHDVDTPYEDLKSEAKAAFERILQDFKSTIEGHEIGDSNARTKKLSKPAEDQININRKRISLSENAKQGSGLHDTTPASSRSDISKEDGPALYPSIHDDSAETREVNEKLKQAETQISSLESQLTAATSEIETLRTKLLQQNPSPIKFTDALNRIYSVPWSKCSNWTDMEHLISQAHQHDEDLTEQIQLRRYDLILITGSEKQIIFRQWWRETVKPGMTITMSMWSSNDTIIMPQTQPRHEEQHHHSQTANLPPSSPPSKLEQLLLQHSTLESTLQSRREISERLESIIVTRPSSSNSEKAARSFRRKVEETQSELNRVAAEIVECAYGYQDENSETSETAGENPKMEKSTNRVSTTARRPRGRGGGVGGREGRKNLSAHVSDG